MDHKDKDTAPQNTQSGHVIYQPLGQPQVIFGCDREVFLVIVLILVCVNVTSYSFMIFLASSALALVSFVGLYQMGQKDIHLRRVWLRSLKYCPYYLAQASFNTSSFKNYLNRDYHRWWSITCICVCFYLFALVFISVVYEGSPVKSLNPLKKPISHALSLALNFKDLSHA